MFSMAIINVIMGDVVNSFPFILYTKNRMFCTSRSITFYIIDLNKKKNRVKASNDFSIQSVLCLCVFCVSLSLWYRQTFYKFYFVVY